MDNELRWQLEKGPTSIQELARLTGKSKSTLYKYLKHEDVQTQEGKNGKLFFVRPTEPSAEPTQNATAAPTTETPKVPVNAPPVAAKRGRKAGFSGQRLFPETSLLTEESPGSYANPRRNGSHGQRSLQIIIDNPGLTSEEYQAKGGRMNDLRWDVQQGHVRVE